MIVIYCVVVNKKVLSGSTNHRIKRETVTEENIVYVVSSDGQDIPACLNSAESNVTCGSITYVVNERCFISNVLTIRIESYDGTYIFREPWQNVNSTAQAYPCRVQLEGIVSNGTKPTVSLSDQVSRKDQIFSVLLKQSSQLCFPESMPGLCKYLPKLEMKNISLENISIDNYGHKVSFTDVLFYEFGFLFSANYTHGCVLHCRGCLFTLHPMKIPKLYNGRSVLKFEECVSAEIIMEEAKLYSTEIQVSFTNKLLANFTDTEMTRTSGHNSSSKMTFLQIDEFMASYWESPTVEFVMKNVRCFNNKPISSMVALNFSNSALNRSNVRIDNATILSSTSFLEYTVDAGAETSMMPAEHLIKLSNLNITNNQGNKEIVSVTQNLNGKNHTGK